MLSRNLRIPNSPCFSSLDGAHESLFTLHVACECSLPSNTNDLKFKKSLIRNSNSRVMDSEREDFYKNLIQDVSSLLDGCDWLV